MIVSILTQTLYWTRIDNIFGRQDVDYPNTESREDN